MAVARPVPSERGPERADPGPESGTACLRLSQLPEGARARLCSHADRDPAPRRLLDLGFVPETPLRVVRRAPLGDPVEIEIRGYRLCVRRDDLEQICVRVQPTAR